MHNDLQNKQQNNMPSLKDLEIPVCIKLTMRRHPVFKVKVLYQTFKYSDGRKETSWNYIMGIGTGNSNALKRILKQK